MYMTYQRHTPAPVKHRKTPTMRTTSSVSDVTEFEIKDRSQNLEIISDYERHNELEQEYRTLKRELTILNDLDLSKRTTVVEGYGKELRERNKKDQPRSNDNTSTMLTGNLEPSSHDFLMSDALGINHFKKHILNVKRTSKRHKRDTKHLSENKKSSTEKIKTKFKPVFEQGHHETCDE